MTVRARPWLTLLTLTLAAPLACGHKGLPNDPDAHVDLRQNPSWQNWSANLTHAPLSSGADYYFSPTSLAELQTILSERPEGVHVRVSGQRHSQPGLVVNDARAADLEQADTWLIDLSCYADLGSDGRQDMVLDRAKLEVTVNAGVREDALDSFLTANDLMLETVTAGGFFSLGGMTAVDVHGATIDAPIFAETAVRFTIVGADGQPTTYSVDDPKVDGYAPMQFARVSLGALGVVTSVTLRVQARPYATSLAFSREKHTLPTRERFTAVYRDMLRQHDRVESFYNPYSREFLALIWDEVADPRREKQNKGYPVASACTYAENALWGAPFEGEFIEKTAEALEERVQLNGKRDEASELINSALVVIELQTDRAARKHRELWLSAATRVMFMSYFIELPADDEEGLARAWEGLDAINKRLDASSAFQLAAPIEFRFIRGGDTAMAGTYSTTPDALFLNLDMIGFVQAVPSEQYPEELLSFFADIERAWVALGGFPHNGKMYGFYDPGAPQGCSPAFNPAFLSELASRRGERMQAFARFRGARDPEGVFCNAYLDAVGVCAPAPTVADSPAEAAPAEASPPVEPASP